GSTGIEGSLPERLHVSDGWDEAIAAALGPWADAAVATHPGAAVDALRAAREAETGTVRLVVAAPGTRAAGVPDGLLPAGSALSSDDDATLAAVRHILGAVVLVEDLAEARAVVEAHPQVVAATREGDLLAATHAVGGSGEEGSSVFALQAAAEEAAREVDQATLSLEAVRFELGPARERVTEARARVAETLSELHASDAAFSASTERLGQLASAIRSAHAEADRAAPAIGRLEGEIAEHEKELAALVERLEIASREPDEAEADLRQATEQRDAASAVAREARRVETEARLRLRTVEERVAAIAGRAASLQSAADAERAARRRAEERERRRQRQASVANETRERAQQALGAVEVSLEQAADARAASEEEREVHTTESARARTRIDQLAAEFSRVTDAAHRDEVARAEQRLRIEQYEEKSIAELGLDPQVLVEEFGPHVPVPVFVPGSADEPETHPFVRGEQEKRLARASKDLERLGKVNPLALEEHAALAERHQYLTDQLADLRKSRMDLLEIVREIDVHVENVFAEAFSDTARQFEQVFTRLFPGGEGKLVLTEPEDMLATGIEIEARPAGKKVKRLSLLSGGERSLTAVALLIAIFKARPSPFYVMDEVEAALDDTNLGRLLELFRELREDSQILVVTHQKRTMEVADALYGVTMRAGVTEVISQRLERA
nr:AAA family ATPase [Actinomycetales bacterium]